MEENVVVKNDIEIETGVTIWFNVQRGFGFIRSIRGDDIFCHYSKIDAPLGEFRMLNSGDEVEFERFIVERGDKKKPQAKNVRIVKKATSTTGSDLREKNETQN